MLDAGFGGAFVAGLLSFISPCVLPIVPAYLAYLAGMSFEEIKGGHQKPEAARRVVFAAVAFVFGFTTIFVALGATASIIGQSIARYFDTLAIVAGLIIIVLGLHFLGLFRINWLYREARFQVARSVLTSSALPLLLAGLLASARCLLPSCLSPALRVRRQRGRFCWRYIRPASAFHFCSPHFLLADLSAGQRGSGNTCIKSKWRWAAF